MRVLDLFSGIGGFSLGLERAGMETVAFCEFDKHARKILSKHWPDITIHEDVRLLDGKQYHGTVELICGGYPCQPFSVAGKQRGTEDDRHLWPDYFRLVKEIKPRWVIAENVTGHISLGLDEVLSDLEGEDYTVETFVIPACALNAHHRRDRLWIVAHSNSARRGEGNKKMADEIPKQLNCGGIQPREANPNPSGFMRERCPEKPFPRVSDLQSKLVRSGETISILPDARKPGVLGVTHGFPGRVDRIKRLGNAVVPQIVELIGSAIMEVENE